MADIAGAYGTFLSELYVAGCRNVQFDDCTWGMFCDPWYQDFLAKAGLSLEAMEKQYLALNNQVLDAKPEDLNVTTHVCRGNYHSTWASQGGYETVAPVLFSREHVSAFYLEFDDERSGGFEPLRFVAPDKKVVLGLVTTKRPQWKIRRCCVRGSPRLPGMSRWNGSASARSVVSPRVRSGTSSPKRNSGRSFGWSGRGAFRVGMKNISFRDVPH